MNVKPSPGPDRGEETRTRLLRAAIDVFGRLGFEGASTRALAEAAGVNLAAIPYHFGSKKGLYLAAARHVADEIGARVGIVAREAGRVAGAGDPAASLAALRSLLGRLAEFLITNKDADTWARLIIREQMRPTDAFAILYDGIMKVILAAVTALVASASGGTVEDETNRIRALTLVGQVLVFRAGRAAAMRHMEWRSVGTDELALIQRVIGENVAAILGSKS